MGPITRRFLLPLTFLSTTTGAVLFLVSACGDDSTGTGGPVATTTLTTPAPTGTPTTTATTTTTSPIDSGPPVNDAGGDANDGAATAGLTGCKKILAENPAAQSGIYTVDVDGAGTTYPALQLYCDMKFDGGGWTLIQSYTGGNSPNNFVGQSEDAGLLIAAPEPGKLGGVAGWVVKALAEKSSQVHIRLSFASDAGADAGTWVTTIAPDAGATTRAMQNLRDLNILTKGTDGGFEEWTGPQATATKLSWVPLYGGGPGTCGNPVELQKYPSIYWACGNFSSMNIFAPQSLCRWSYTGGGGNEPMEVYIR